MIKWKKRFGDSIMLQNCLAIKRELTFVVFRPSPSGEDSYNVRVSVDGKWLDNTGGTVYCGGECVFKVWEWI